MNAPIRPPSPENASPQQIYRAILATDFRAFVDYVFGLLRPGIPFKPNWHIDAMAHKVSQVASGDVKRLIITVPPRNLKSIIASVALPAWYLGHNPSERVVAVSYSAELAKTHSNDFRRVVTDPVYQAVFPKMILSRETDSEIHTTLRGRRYATSIGGTLTGRGGNLFIIDDPLKPSDALSEVSRQRVIEWFGSTLSTRADDKQKARIVVVMQRIHVEDLVGHLLENEAGYEVLNLPAVAQSTATYDLGGGRTHTREKGDLLHPAHEPAEVLRELKKSMGSMLFSAQYQQAPEPAGGKIIKRKMLQYYTALEPLPTDRLVLSWDIALSEQEAGNYSVGIALLIRGDSYYVREVLRGKFPFGKLKDKIIDMNQRYGKKASLVIEDSPISMGLIQSLLEKHINVVEIKPDRDKQSRLISQIDLFEGGSVLLPKDAPWLDAFVSELLSFPGRHDDQVDALSQGLAWYRQTWKPPLVQRTTYGMSGYAPPPSNPGPASQ
jgi:predicted phage terminase large subunit-like protein